MAIGKAMAPMTAVTCTAASHFMLVMWSSLCFPRSCDISDMNGPEAANVGHPRKRRANSIVVFSWIQNASHYSRDRRGEHLQAHLANYSGILQADAFGGYTKLYERQRSPGPIREAACWVHARRPFFAMADHLEENARRKAAGNKEIALSPIAIEIVRRIDALFAIGNMAQ